MLAVASFLVLSGCGGTPATDARSTVTLEPGPEGPAVHDDLHVVCDAEHVDAEDGASIMYLVQPGAPLECTVTGLVADLDASWDVQLFDDDLADVDEPVRTFDGVLTVVGGEGRFTTPVPDEPPLLWLVARVTQGARDAYVRGQTHWSWAAPMTCRPDPATEGDAVECRAEGIQPDDEFHWDVMFDDGSGRTLERLRGTGTTDASGRAVFGFEVPSGRRIVRYGASATQRYDHAEFDGTIR
jgi:hypothetical protein